MDAKAVNAEPTEAESLEERSSAPAPRRRRSSQLGEQFAYGGVDFELLPDFECALPEGQAEYAEVRPREPGAGQVRCALSCDPALEHETHTREIVWEWEGERAEVRTGRARVELLRLGPGSYAATARATPDANGVSAVVTALSGAVVYREGGLVLHAAGIELDGKALLFIGPASAGKTTACNHTPGGSWFARDRAAVVPGGGGWSAWGMAGGDPVVLPRAPASSYPLSAILRVRRATEEPGVRTLGSREAVGVLRESMQSGGLSRAEEQQRFDAMTRLAGDVRIGEVRTRLDAPITDMLREWLHRDG